MNPEHLERNLKALLSKPLDSTSLDILRQAVNYTEADGCKNLNILISAIKVAGNSDSIIYCVTKLNNIKKVLNSYRENPTLDLPLNQKNLTIDDFIEWFISNQETKRKLSSNSLIFKEFKVSKPLRISDKTYKDWLSLNLDMEIMRNVYTD